MRKFIITMMLALMALTISISDADARRLGGGGSFGKQSQSFSRPAPSQNQPANLARPGSPTAPAGIPAKPASPWKGILGGALLGLGLGALFSHLGIGGAMGGMLGTLLMFALIAAVAMFVYRLFQQKTGNSGGIQPAYSGGNSSYTPEIGSRIEPLQRDANQPTSFASGAMGNAPLDIPADFDVPGFLRHAKTHFIRLQAAWDKADVNDIREFTTPEMFAELKMQLQERGASPNNTDVVSLNADLLGLETASTDHLASVKFSGMIKESDQAPAEPFAEIWNLTKPMSGQGGWALAGIQQVS